MTHRFGPLLAGLTIIALAWAFLAFWLAVI
jgi:hypothetical protein